MGSGHALKELAPGVWSNGHLRFDPAPRNGRPAWIVRMASAGADAPAVAHIRFNSVWREYALLTRGGFVFAHDCLADISELLRWLNEGLSMISDLELVEAAAATYTDAPTLPVPDTGVDCRVTQASDGAALVAFRGSKTAEDWARDFVFVPIVDREHPLLGRCHAGFLDAAISILPAVQDAIGKRPCYITGHSLGGAIAQGVGALMVCGGRPPQAIVTFGSPRFGMDQFVNALVSVPMRLYRRGNDLVPLVPWDVPPELRFLDARAPLIAIGRAQADPLAAHHIEGYVADVRAYLAAKAAAVAA